MASPPTEAPNTSGVGEVGDFPTVSISATVAPVPSKIHLSAAMTRVNGGALAK